MSALTAAAVATVVAVLIISTGGGGARLIQARVTGISGSAHLRVENSHGELIVRHLTPPRAGHVYEVWLEATGHNPVPANVLFSVSAGGDASVAIPRGLKGVSQLMVTAEPDGGSQAPTSQPVIVAQLS